MNVADNFSIKLAKYYIQWIWGHTLFYYKKLCFYKVLIRLDFIFNKKDIYKKKCIFKQKS